MKQKNSFLKNILLLLFLFYTAASGLCSFCLNSSGLSSAFAAGISKPQNNETIFYDYRPRGDITLTFELDSPADLVISAGTQAKSREIFSTPVSPDPQTGLASLRLPLSMLLGTKTSTALKCDLFCGNDNSLIHSIFFKIERARKNALWHWPSDFETSKKEDMPLLLQLNKKGLNVIFARYAHFSTKNNAPDFAKINYGPEYFPGLSMAGIEIHPSFSFSDEFRSAYDSNEEYSKSLDFCSAKFIIEKIKTSVKDIKPYIRGIQLDMEGLKDLDKYSCLVTHIKNDPFFKDLYISICPQVSWKYKIFQIRRLLAQCDFAAIMIYDHRWGLYADRNIPLLNIPVPIVTTLKVSDPDWIKSTIKKYDKYKIPFYAGVPSYDYIKVYGTDKKARDHWSLLRTDRQENLDFLKSLADSPDFECQIYEKPFKNDLDLAYQFKALKDTHVMSWNREFPIYKDEYIKADILTADTVKGYCRAALDAGLKTSYFTGFSIFKLATTSVDEFIDNPDAE
jgi:hypothetical protein